MSPRLSPAGWLLGCPCTLGCSTALPTADQHSDQSGQQALLTEARWVQLPLPAGTALETGATSVHLSSPSPPWPPLGLLPGPVPEGGRDGKRDRDSRKRSETPHPHPRRAQVPAPSLHSCSWASLHSAAPAEKDHLPVPNTFGDQDPAPRQLPTAPRALVCVALPNFPASLFLPLHGRCLLCHRATRASSPLGPEPLLSENGVSVGVAPQE